MFFDEEIGIWVVDSVDEEGRQVKLYYDDKNESWVKRYPYEGSDESSALQHPKGSDITTARVEKSGVNYTQDDGLHRAYRGSTD
jgi:hypothetical protein